MRAILIGIISGLVASWAVSYYWSSPETVAKVAAASAAALVEAYDRGKTDALRTNPISWDLEMTCLNLWANKQPTP